MDLKNLIKINLKNKIIIGSILFPVTIGCIIIFIVIPTIDDIKNIKNEIETQRIDLEVKYKRGQSLKKLTEDLKLIEPQLSKLEYIFIEEDKVLDFITNLEDIASDNNVTQKLNLSSDNAVFNNSYKKTPLQIITNGNFINQINYMAALENLNSFININNLELTFSSGPSVTSEGESINSSISMLLFADTYWK